MSLYGVCSFYCVIKVAYHICVQSPCWYSLHHKIGSLRYLWTVYMMSYKLMNITTNKNISHIKLINWPIYSLPYNFWMTKNQISHSFSWYEEICSTHWVFICWQHNFKTTIKIFPLLAEAVPLWSMAQNPREFDRKISELYKSKKAFYVI